MVFHQPGSSITFSELAVESIERVLRPGGIFKGTFRGRIWDGLYNQLGYRPHDRFSTQFKRLGYDVAIKRAKEIGQDDIILVINRGQER